jgi:hypothetical protein
VTFPDLDPVAFKRESTNKYTYKNARARMTATRALNSAVCAVSIDGSVAVGAIAARDVVAAARVGSPASASSTQTVPCTTTGSECGSGINACATVREGGGRWLPRAERTARTHGGGCCARRGKARPKAPRRPYRRPTRRTWTRAWRFARASQGLRTRARQHELLGELEAEAAALSSCISAGILLGPGGQVLV